MNIFIRAIASLFMFVAATTTSSCGGSSEQSSDTKQQAGQEKILQELTAQTGMPAIKNGRERKILKTILELRDQEGYVTYTYMENELPAVVKGVTAKGGKLTYLGQTMGYPIPYSTQYTNPQKIAESSHQVGYAILPQADPNGLFSPSSAEATWILMKNPSGKDVVPVYCEPRILCLPFQLPFD